MAFIVANNGCGKSIFISQTDPSKFIVFTVGAVMIAFSSATQDIIIDAYRIESAPQKAQGALSSMYISGYRIAMLVAGAGSLFLASYFGVEEYDVAVWKNVYLIMACFMSIGILTTLFSPEPSIKRANSIIKINDQLKFIFSFIVAITIFIIAYSKTNLPIDLNSPIKKFFFTFSKLLFGFIFSSLTIFFLIKVKIIPRKSAVNAYAKPVLDFMNRYGKVAILILLLIGLYRIRYSYGSSCKYFLFRKRI